MFGMFRSRRTRSQRELAAFLMADNPLSASSQTRYRVLVSKNSWMAPRTAALSSTTRIQGLRAGDIATKAILFSVWRQYEYAYFSVSHYQWDVTSQPKAPVYYQIARNNEKSTSLTSVLVCRHRRDNGREFANGHIADTRSESVRLLCRNGESTSPGRLNNSQNLRR